MPSWNSKLLHSSSNRYLRNQNHISISVFVKPSSSMASKTFSHELVLLLVALLATVQMTVAGDADIITDFVSPLNTTVVTGDYFTFTGMRVLVGAELPATFKVLKASMAELPALNGQSVSSAYLQYPPGSINPPHTHPRSAELLFLAYGTLEVGFVDTTNKLYTQTLQAGDMFIFPKGLIHYQYNADAAKPAAAVSSFGSANAGTVSVPTTLFVTGIDENILAKSFKTDVATIQAIKAGLIPKA